MPVIRTRVREDQSRRELPREKVLATTVEKTVRAHAQCEKIDNAIRHLGYMEG